MVIGGDGRAFAREAEGMDVCTGEVTIRRPGSRAREYPLRGLRGSALGFSVIEGHRGAAHLVVPGR